MVSTLALYSNNPGLYLASSEFPPYALLCCKKTYINEKEAGVGPFKKTLRHHVQEQLERTLAGARGPRSTVWLALQTRASLKTILNWALAHGLLVRRIEAGLQLVFF